MSKRNSWRVTAVACLRVAGAAWLLSSIGFALAQSPPAGPASAGKGKPAATPAGDANDSTPAATEPAKTTPAKPAAAIGSPQHFEPTEKVRPDFDVAFPVDI